MLIDRYSCSAPITHHRSYWSDPREQTTSLHPEKEFSVVFSLSPLFEFLTCRPCTPWRRNPTLCATTSSKVIYTRRFNAETRRSSTHIVSWSRAFQKWVRKVTSLKLDRPPLHPPELHHYMHTSEVKGNANVMVENFRNLPLPLPV